MQFNFEDGSSYKGKNNFRFSLKNWCI